MPKHIDKTKVKAKTKKVAMKINGSKFSSKPKPKKRTRKA